MKIAICVGHSRKINGRTEGGAISVDGTSEWEYNSGLADMISDQLDTLGHQVGIIDDYQGSGYTAAMEWVADQVEEWDADCAIELHFNSATPLGNGHEWLHWATSSRGKALAAHVEAAVIEAVPELRQRGVKAKGKGDRGGAFLRVTHCPALIAEPFFGSNEEDWQIAIEKKVAIAKAIAHGIDAWAESLD